MSAPEAPALPDPGEWYFWRIVQRGETVNLELREYRKTIGNTRRSHLYGLRGPLFPTTEQINSWAKDLLKSRDRQLNSRKNAARWAGDYPSTKGASA